MKILYCVWTGWFVRLSNWQRCSLRRSRRTWSVINNRSTHAVENIHISVKLLLCYVKMGVMYEGIVVIITLCIRVGWLIQHEYMLLYAGYIWLHKITGKILIRIWDITIPHIRMHVLPVLPYSIHTWHWAYYTSTISADTPQSSLAHHNQPILDVYGGMSNKPYNLHIYIHYLRAGPSCIT